MADTTLSIAVTAELADFRRAMSELPDIGSQEARDMVTGIRRQLQAAERAAKSTSDTIRKDLGDGFKDIEGVSSRVLEKMGGQFGDLGDIVFDVLGPLGKMHPALMAIGGAAVAVGATATALFSIANAALEARDRLEEMGVEVDAAQSARLDTYADATERLWTAFDELKVAVGGDIALGLAAVVDTAARGIQAFKDLRDTTDPTIEAFGLMNRAALALVTLGLSELVRWTYEQVTANYELQLSTGELTLMQKMALQAQQLAVVAKQDEIEGARQNALAKQAEAEAAKAAAAAAQAQTDAQEALNAEIEAAIKADDWPDPTPIQRKQEDATWDIVKAQIALNRAMEETPKEAAKAAKEIGKLRDDFAADMDAYTKEALKYLGTVVLDTASQIGDTLMGINQRTIDGYESRLAAGEKLSDAELRDLDRARNAQKAAALAQAAYQASVTAAGVSANLAPALGPGGVAIGVAIGAGLFAASAAAIESESAIKFDPMGLYNSMLDWLFPDTNPGSGEQRNLLDDDPSAEDFEGGGKPAQSGDQLARRGGGGGIHISLDDRLKRLSVTSDTRPGKRPRRR